MSLYSYADRRSCTRANHYPLLPEVDEKCCKYFNRSVIWTDEEILSFLRNIMHILYTFIYTDVQTKDWNDNISHAPLIVRKGQVDNTWRTALLS